MFQRDNNPNEDRAGKNNTEGHQSGFNVARKPTNRGGLNSWFLDNNVFWPFTADYAV